MSPTGQAPEILGAHCRPSPVLPGLTALAAGAGRNRTRARAATSEDPEGVFRTSPWSRPGDPTGQASSSAAVSGLRVQRRRGALGLVMVAFDEQQRRRRGSPIRSAPPWARSSGRCRRTTGQQAATMRQHGSAAPDGGGGWAWKRRALVARHRGPACWVEHRATAAMPGRQWTEEADPWAGHRAAWPVGTCYAIFIALAAVRAYRTDRTQRQPPRRQSSSAAPRAPGSA